MKVQLRRVHVRIDVTTEQGERRDVVITHRPREGRAPLLLLRFMQWALRRFGLVLVDDVSETEPALLDDFEPFEESGPNPDAAPAFARGEPHRLRLASSPDADAAPVGAPAVARLEPDAAPATLVKLSASSSPPPSSGRVVIRDEQGQTVAVRSASVVVPATVLPGVSAPAPAPAEPRDPADDTKPATVQS